MNEDRPQPTARSRAHGIPAVPAVPALNWNDHSLWRDFIATTDEDSGNPALMVNACHCGWASSDGLIDRCPDCACVPVLISLLPDQLRTLVCFNN